jgi:outer membrane protein
MKFYVITGILLFSSFLLAQETLQLDSLKLKDLLIKSNGDVAAAKTQQDAMEKRDGLLMRKFLPSLTLEGGVEKFSTGYYDDLNQSFGSALVNLNLFNGGRDFNASKIIDSTVQITQTEYDQALIDGLLKLRTVYWEYLYEKEVVNILSMATEMNDKNLSSARLRIKNGIATRTDELEFRQNSLQVEQDLQRASMELVNRDRELRALIGIEESIGVKSEEEIPHEHSDELLNMNFEVEKHRDNRRLSYQQEVLENQRKVEGRWWIPSLDVYGSAAHHTQKERDYLSSSLRNDYTLGIKISMNLFDGGESFNLANSMALQRKAIEYQFGQKKRELTADYKNTRALMELTHSQIHNAEENVALSEEYYKSTIGEYGRGIKNSPDVLSASQRLVNARLRLLDLKKDYQLSRAKLMNILGI